MSYQKHCPGCYAEKGGAAVCPACGYDESAERSPLFLPHGIILGGQYRVGRVLGKPGGFGITYIGWDIHLQQRVAIKEFMPRDLVSRSADSLEVRPHTDEDRERFDLGKEQFLREARIVARFSHPNIVRVRAFFNANGTAYLVMDYYEGLSLGDYLSSVRNSMPPAVALGLIRPILEGLQFVHERDVIHRDLKPHNIYLAAEGRPILLDFGAALLSKGQHTNSLAVVLTEGYAPLEQYQKRSPQGPYTDVYGAAATLYRMIAGESPPMALDRLGYDPLQESGFVALPPGLRPVLAKALAVRPQDRYATAAEFLQALAEYRDEPEDNEGLAAVFKPLPAETAARPTVEVSSSEATRIVLLDSVHAPPVPTSYELPRRWKWVFAALAGLAFGEFLILLRLLF